MKNLIDLESIRYRFAGSDWELRLDALSLKSHEILSIIGPNGSGKTTLLRIASGILHPLQGRVSTADRDLRRLDRRAIARHIGYLPQELTSEYNFTVADLVAMGRYPHAKGFGRMDSTDLRAVKDSLELTEMEALQQRRLSQLSGGEKKRAFLASVLAQEPRALLLDEPTGALDLHHQVRFFRLLKILSERGIGIMVVTHDLNLASLFSHRLMLLVDGRCHALGPPDRVLSDENVRSVYSDTVLMNRHPEIDRPVLLPRFPGETLS